MDDINWASGELTIHGKGSQDHSLPLPSDVGEALALNCEDVDLDQGILTIRLTKFTKTRLAPVHETPLRELRRYAQRRDRIYPHAATSAFFLSDHGARVTFW